MALLALDAEDAVFESPLVPHFLGGDCGLLRGHKEIKPLFDLLATRKPPQRLYARTGYLTDGKRLIWEYPRDAGKGEQMDFVQVMDLDEHGLIQRHCVYWGWFVVRVLQRNEYHPWSVMGRCVVGVRISPARRRTPHESAQGLDGWPTANCTQSLVRPDRTSSSKRGVCFIGLGRKDARRTLKPYGAVAARYFTSAWSER